MAVKLIVSDIDGTLVGKSGKLSQALIGTLRELKKRGVIVALASGRTFYGARVVALEAGLNCPIISANGGRCDMDTDGAGEPLYEDTLDRETSLFIYETLRNAGCFMTSYVGKKIYALNEINGYGSAGVKRSEVFGENLGHIILDDEERFFREGTVSPYKYEAYTDDEALMDKIRRIFLERKLSVSSAFPYNLEILSAGGGKARAVKSLARKLNIALSEVMTMGDGSNDLGMLEIAGYPVAMGNAVEVLKNAAKYIAPHVDEDGARIILEKLVLSEERE